MINNRVGKIVQPNQQPLKPISLQEAVAGLMNFMDGQMQFNKEVRGDLTFINIELYEPAMRDKQNISCMSAIL